MGLGLGLGLPGIVGLMRFKGAVKAAKSLCGGACRLDLAYPASRRRGRLRTSTAFDPCR
jgi:hypothetical protein